MKNKISYEAFKELFDQGPKVVEYVGNRDYFLAIEYLIKKAPPCYLEAKLSGTNIIEIILVSVEEGKEKRMLVEKFKPYEFVENFVFSNL